MVITVGIVGNPNVGKTSLFNRLVGARQHVANWPGVTVTRIEGTTTYKNHTLHFVDLPGTYSLFATSIDEKVTRDFLLLTPPNVVLVIVDSVAPEQGLYLLLETVELGLNVVAVFNAIDEARRLGITINREAIETFLGVPVVLTSAVTGEGIPELLDTVVAAFKTAERPKMMAYPEPVEKAIKALEKRLTGNFDKRFAAIKVIEGDTFILQLLGTSLAEGEMSEFKELAVEISRTKYDYIMEVLAASYGRVDKVLTITEAIDHVLTHRYLGIPIFLALLYLAFNFTFKVSEPFVALVETVFTGLSELVGESGILSSMLSRGVIDGLGSVLTFVPSIFTLFFVLGLMEDTGYLPRIAFLMDKLMYRLRLTGRALMILLLGFGCNVSSVMAARALPDERERITTVLVSPFISCSARLPVYLMIASVAFPNHKAEVFFLVYALSVALTALSARFVNKALLKGESVPLVIELPRYRVPKFSTILNYMWNRGKHFLIKAGTIILLTSVVVWAFTYFPNPEDIQTSFAAKLGRSLEFLFKPLGFDWRTITALIFGGVAKEVVVSSFAQLYGSLENVQLDPRTGLTLLVFVLGYVPCLATLAVIRSETNGWRYVVFSVVYSLVVSYALAYVVSILAKAFV